jgi:hypothetical protein
MGWPLELSAGVIKLLEHGGVRGFDPEVVRSVHRIAGGSGGFDEPAAIALVALIRGAQPDHFIHPAHRALMIHEQVMTSDLFGDRREATACLLTVWFMRAQGYAVFDHLELSRVGGVPRGCDEPALLEWLERIQRAIEWMQKAFATDDSAPNDLSPGSQRLNPRQRDVLAAVRDNPAREFTMEAHRRIHNVAYATARADLYDLRDAGFLAAKKRGKAWVFHAALDSHANARETQEINAPPAPPRDWRVW